MERMELVVGGDVTFADAQGRPVLGPIKIVLGPGIEKVASQAAALAREFGEMAEITRQTGNVLQRKPSERRAREYKVGWPVSHCAFCNLVTIGEDKPCRCGDPDAIRNYVVAKVDEAENMLGLSCHLQNCKVLWVRMGRP